jgi:hypothetical protein
MNQLIKHEEQKQKINTYKDLATVAVRSGCYDQMSVDKAINLMLSAADLGVSPMKALNGGFHIIKGKIAMAGHLISDRIRSAGHSVKVIEHTREKCVIIGVRKDNGDSYKSEFDMEDAKLAGLLSSPPWKSYPKDMLYNRAIARLGRILFSDVIGACYSEDEGNDIAGIPAEQRACHDPDEIIIRSSVSEKEPPVVQREPLECLEEHLKSDGISVHVLQQYLSELAAKKNENPDLIIQSALLPELLPKFKAAYQRFLGRLLEAESLPVPDAVASA